MTMFTVRIKQMLYQCNNQKPGRVSIMKSFEALCVYSNRSRTPVGSSVQKYVFCWFSSTKRLQFSRPLVLLQLLLLPATNWFQCKIVEGTFSRQGRQLRKYFNVKFLHVGCLIRNLSLILELPGVLGQGSGWLAVWRDICSSIFIFLTVIDCPLLCFLCPDIRAIPHLRTIPDKGRK